LQGRNGFLKKKDDSRHRILKKIRAVQKIFWGAKEEKNDYDLFF
jgi:hypothetical protein